jgi:hypothetical protein
MKRKLDMDYTQACYTAIRDYIHQHGIAPTIREVSTATGITSTSVVSKHIEQLEFGGYITRVPFKARSIQLATDTQALNTNQIYAIVNRARSCKADLVPNLDYKQLWTLLNGLYGYQGTMIMLDVPGDRDGMCKALLNEVYTLMLSAVEDAVHEIEQGMKTAKVTP